MTRLQEKTGHADATRLVTVSTVCQALLISQKRTILSNSRCDSLAFDYIYVWSLSYIFLH
jgi:hypothetical protein